MRQVVSHLLSLSRDLCFRQGKLRVGEVMRTRNSTSVGVSLREPVTQARLVLATTFLKRSVKMLERVSSVASSETLKAALSSPTDVGGVASLLSDLAPLGIDLSSVDPFVEAMSRGATVKRELLESAGGGLTSSQVAAALGITRQAVDKRRTGKHDDAGSTQVRESRKCDRCRRVVWGAGCLGRADD
jgi:hypothetical protein